MEHSELNSTLIMKPNPYEIDVTVPMRAAYVLYCAGIDLRPKAVWTPRATVRDDGVTAEEWDLINQAECRAWDDLISTPMPRRYGTWKQFRAEYEAMLTKPCPSDLLTMAARYAERDVRMSPLAMIQAALP